MGDADGLRHRAIDQLAGLVGRYCWLEHRLFVLTGTAASHRHGALAALPVSTKSRSSSQQ